MLPTRASQQGQRLMLPERLTGEIFGGVDQGNGRTRSPLRLVNIAVLGPFTTRGWLSLLLPARFTISLRRPFEGHWSNFSGMRQKDGEPGARGKVGARYRPMMPPRPFRCSCAGLVESPTSRHGTTEFDWPHFRLAVTMRSGPCSV